MLHKFMKKNKKKLSIRQGSVLVFSLFLMMISLIVGIGLMSTSNIGRKSTLSSAKSVNSFQVADSGIEYAFTKIRDYRWNETTDTNHELEAADLLSHVFGSDCQVENSLAVVNGTVDGGGDFKIYFFRGAGGVTPITTCNTLVSSSVELVTKIKSVGTYNGITRSVEATVDLSKL